MATLNPYLNFAGNAEEAFNFYQSVFGGEFSAVARFKDMPMPDMELSPEAGERIAHIGLPIGENNILMASDVLTDFGQKLTPGNNVYISLHPDSREEADRIFSALAVDGRIEMPIADQFWGDYFGSLQDKFGVLWMINFHAEVAS